MRPPRSPKSDAVHGSISAEETRRLFDFAYDYDDSFFFGLTSSPRDPYPQVTIDASGLAHAAEPVLAGSTTKSPSPRGQKRGRGTADDDDDAGVARRRVTGTAVVASPRMGSSACSAKRDAATQVCEADFLLPSRGAMMRDASTQFPEVEGPSVEASCRERSPVAVDNDQEVPVAAGPLLSRRGGRRL